MTTGERRDSLMQFGFTSRQAGFLELVMIHAGVCVQRQYATFCGIKFGHNTRDFFDRLTASRYATAYPCRRSGARIFHVHQKALYSAIGQADNRNRRPATVSRALERLLILDALLTPRLRQLRWLGTVDEKCSLFLADGRVGRADLPALRFARAGRLEERYFWHKLPIGTSPIEPAVHFLVPFADPRGHGLKAWLSDHRRLLLRLHRWAIVLIVPRAFVGASPVFSGIMRDFFAPPLQHRVVDEFRWYCETRRAAETGTATASINTPRYVTARRAYGSPRFHDAYRRWAASHDNSVFDDLVTGRLFEAWQRRHVSWTSHVIDQQYEHLLPTVLGSAAAS
jgi:hypothetical protein